MTIADTPQRTQQRTSVFEELVSPLRSFFSLTLEMKIVLGILVLLSVWGLAILAFGVPALVWPMKVIVPASIVGLVLLTWGLL